MTRNNFKIFSYLLIMVFLTLGLSISFQSLLAAWVAPAGNPPTCLTGDPGCDEPINKGSFSQTKAGPLRVNADNLAATGFVAYGNVGIGTTNPTNPLQLGNVFTLAQDINSGYIGANFGSGTGGNYIKSQYANQIMFDSAAGKINFKVAPSGTAGNAISYTTAMTIISDGNVGIGTAGPQEKLDVLGSKMLVSNGLSEGYSYPASWGKFATIGDALSDYSRPAGLYGLDVAWSSDWVMLGMIDRAGSNAKDAALVWGDDAGDRLLLKNCIGASCVNTMILDGSNVTVAGTAYQRGGQTVCDSSNNCGYLASGGSPTFSSLNLSAYNPINFTYNGWNAPNGTFRWTPNLHMNTINGYGVYVNWDNGYTGALEFVVGNGAGGYAFRTYGDGRSYAEGSLYTPILYDNNDSGYYLDPNKAGDWGARQRSGTLYGPNGPWGAYLAVGAYDGNRAGANQAQVISTNGNLHLDSGSGNDMYLNYYSSGRPIHVYGPMDTNSSGTFSNNAVAIGSNTATGCSSSLTSIMLGGSRIWDPCDGKLHLYAGGGGSYPVQVDGNLNVTGTAYANGQALCQANGTNCPASPVGGTAERIVQKVTRIATWPGYNCATAGGDTADGNPCDNDLYKCTRADALANRTVTDVFGYNGWDAYDTIQCSMEYTKDSGSSIQIELNEPSNTYWECADYNLQDYCGDDDGCRIVYLGQHKIDDTTRVIENFIYMEQTGWSGNRAAGLYGYTRQDGGEYGWINGDGTGDIIMGPWSWTYILNYYYSNCGGNNTAFSNPYIFRFSTHPHIYSKYIIYDKP